MNRDVTKFKIHNIVHIVEHDGCKTCSKLQNIRMRMMAQNPEAKVTKGRVGGVESFAEKLWKSSALKAAKSIQLR